MQCFGETVFFFLGNKLGDGFRPSYTLLMNKHCFEKLIVAYFVDLLDLLNCPDDLALIEKLLKSFWGVLHNNFTLFKTKFFA